MGNLRCWNNIHCGNKDLCHCSMDVSWLHVIGPGKLNLILAAAVNSRVMTGESQTESWSFASRHPLHYFVEKHTVISLYVIDNNTWMINFDSPIYPTLLQKVSHLGGCFCTFEILVHYTGKSLKPPTAVRRLSSGSLTPTPIREYNGLRGEDNGPFNGQRASTSNPVMCSRDQTRSVSSGINGEFGAPYQPWQSFS